ncbi:hypothetical protein [Cellulomonas sp. NPDC058312]|jgi:hypothetical protein|uniref:hypothetical protein n=1 Tax=Cellulomonas sp. NPDC058312 TaxID=3346441 RepID=UPI0036F05709
MSDEYLVDSYTLGLSADDWSDQGSRMRTARDRVADASTAGFTPAVSGAAARWTSGWGTTLGGVADRAEEIGEQLRSAATAYAVTDIEAQERFQTWLGGTP